MKRGICVPAKEFQTNLKVSDIMDNLDLEETTEIQKNGPTRRAHMAMAVFEDRISAAELRFFRGVVINLSEGNQLFHNHVDSGYRYSYPKVQYKLLDGRPAVLGIDEGADAVTDIFSGRQSLHCRLGNSGRELHVASLADWHEEIGLSDSPCTYRLENWLPLNSRNLMEYNQAEGIIGRLALLQRILTGNILSFAKGMGLFFDCQVCCTIEDIGSGSGSGFKGIDFMEFSAVFKSDVLLPQWIGLGKSASLNHGIVLKQ